MARVVVPVCAHSYDSDLELLALPTNSPTTDCRTTSACDTHVLLRCYCRALVWLLESPNNKVTNTSTRPGTHKLSESVPASPQPRAGLAGGLPPLTVAATTSPQSDSDGTGDSTLKRRLPTPPKGEQA